MRDRFVWKRYANILLMMLATIASTIVSAAAGGRYIDEVIVYVLTDIAFFAIFLYVLERSRLRGLLFGNRETTYRRVLAGYAICQAMVAAGAFLPAFLRPVILVSLVMASFSTEEVAILVGIHAGCVLGLSSGGSVQEMALYCIMALAGAVLSETLEHRSMVFWDEIIVFSMCTMLPGLFSYLAYREANLALFGEGVIEGLIVVLFLIFFHQRLLSKKKTEVADSMDDLIDESYPLQREIEKFSRAEYAHARRVSEVSGRCAGQIGADERLCEAAGMYYRVGILEEGDSIAENGVAIAQRACFPEAVIRIISEYGGELALPSTRESAIVHMVDGLLKKLEALRERTGESEWNQDMVIYQTLNEFSAKGIYDQSGLSMNMFLAIREYLVKEEDLL